MGVGNLELGVFTFVVFRFTPLQRISRRRKQPQIINHKSTLPAGWWSQGVNNKLAYMWKEQDNKLYRKFEFKNFSEAFAFMTRVALEAEKMDHHPLWTNVWNQVEIWLNTHSAGNIVTDKDRQLAKKIDALV